MSTIIFEILFILLLAVANGLFSISEFAVISSRAPRLQQRAKKGDSGAQAALELAAEPTAFLSTVQIGITLIGILAGVLGGATIAEQIAAALAVLPPIAPYSEAIGIGIVVLAITYLSLVIGELAPKRIAMNNAEAIASSVAKPMRMLSRIASPIVRALSFSTETVLRIFRVHEQKAVPVTEDEIKLMLFHGAQTGAFEQAEREMIERVFRLADKSAAVLMTPRKSIVWIDIGSSSEEIRQKIIDNSYSVFPVARDNLDNVLGIVQAKNLLDANLSGKPLDLKSLLQHTLFVPESMPAFKTLELFKQNRKHMAMVVNEYGGVQGLVTIHDILEAIVGDVPFAEDADEQIVRREDGSWLLDGMLPVEKFKDHLSIERLPGEDEGYYQTLGGFVTTQLKKIPSPGDHFEWNSIRFEVVDMDGQRVDKVLVNSTGPLPKI